MRTFAPLLLSCGMSSHEYWYGNVYLVEQYLTAYLLKRQEQNWLAWLNGMYVFDAVSAVLSNIHFDKKIHKKVFPMEKPMDIMPKSKEDRQAEEQDSQRKLIEQLNKLKDRWDNDHAE